MTRVPRIAVAAAVLVPVPTGGPAPRIPLCPGLTIVTAVSQPDGDYESIKTIESVTSTDVGINYSSESPENGVTRRMKARRNVRLADLRGASFYLHHFSSQAAVTVPGSTALGTSSAVLHELKTTGSTRLGIIEGAYAATPADPAKHPNIFDYQMVETLKRAGAGTVMVPVIVNDVAVTLPAIEATANYTGDKADFLFLDDESNPIALRYRIGKDALDVVKINFTCKETPKAAQVALTRLEQALLATGRADVYSIYFSFNSDELRPESDSTLKEIGEVMRRHPDWKLAVNGHTDNIGGDTYNLALSQRRAASVTSALEKRFSVAAGRLSATGSGSKSPKDTNATLEGRARNRRVELVRSS